MREFRKLPKLAKTIAVGESLLLNMKQFKGVVPLLCELKNDALRERHWHTLMQKTGKYFDLAPDRFKLENVFAMELHKYQVSLYYSVCFLTTSIAIQDTTSSKSNKPFILFNLYHLSFYICIFFSLFSSFYIYLSKTFIYLY